MSIQTTATAIGQDASIGALIGGIVGGIAGLFSDAANHQSHVQKHAQDYQKISVCALNGDVAATRKILWGKDNDYNELKASLTQAWATIQAGNPAVAAAAQNLGGLSNTSSDLDALAANCMSSPGTGVGNPASVAQQSIVGQYRTDPATAGALPSVSSIATNLAYGDPKSWLVVAGIAIVGAVLWKHKGAL